METVLRFKYYQQWYEIKQNIVKYNVDGDKLKTKTPFNLNT